jgi:hypothetical protein
MQGLLKLKMAIKEQDLSKLRSQVSNLRSLRLAAQDVALSRAKTGVRVP